MPASRRAVAVDEPFAGQHRLVHTGPGTGAVKVGRVGGRPRCAGDGSVPAAERIPVADKLDEVACIEMAAQRGGLTGIILPPIVQTKNV